MTNLPSVKACAEKFLAQSNRLDVLMANAGIMAVDAALTEDGYEVQFQVNHLAHALLMKMLLPTLRSTAALPDGDARVISLSSLAHDLAPKMGIDFATLKTEQSHLGGLIPGAKWSRYGQSKLANMLYAQELAKHYPKITSVSIHPGFIITDLYSGSSMLTMLPALIRSIGQRIPVSQGHYNQTWAATCPKEQLKNGEYYVPMATLGERKTKQANDVKLAEELWNWTEKELKSVV
jgi:NAD(P)-dependent dehydrogenase (short-subunit alcohol dehydrogenase family)